MKKYIYTIVATTAMLASCSQDAELNEVIDNQSKTITEIGATTSAETRAVVSSTDNTKVNWESGDKLGVFGTGASGVVDYTLDGTTGTTSGTFKNASSTITAIQAMMYPYQSTATWASSTLTCEIPTVQTATAGSFDKNAAIMYGIGSSTNATLNYAVAFLKVNIPSGTTNVHAISVYSSTALSGKVDITSTGVAAASAGSESYVTLQADASNGALAAGDYYIAVLPGTLADLSIAYKYTDHTAKAKQSSNSGGSSLTLAAGHIKAISANFSTGTVRDAVQLWENGPYFATMNVGETTENGNTQMYKWGATVAGDGGSQNSGDYDLDHDTAYKIWGSAWRMPTKDEFSALNTNKSSVSYGQPSGTLGFTIQGATGYGSIFLPAGVGSDALNGDAVCWSATPGGYGAFSLYPSCWGGSDPSVDPEDSNERSYCYFVRAILR